MASPIDRESRRPTQKAPLSVKVMQVTKQQLADRAVLDELKGIDDDFEDGSMFGSLLDKRVKMFNPHASPEELDRIKERCRQKLTRYRAEKARQEADAARRHLENALAKLGEDPAKRANAVVSRPTRRNKKYETIDRLLRHTAESRPKSHQEVFEQLESRHIEGRRVPIPPAEPFASARGWIAGFQKDPAGARAWLSKRWKALGLPPFPRGPK